MQKKDEYEKWDDVKIDFVYNKLCKTKVNDQCIIMLKVVCCT